MDLLLKQLHYTSFAGRGFKQLASQQVPLEVHKAFSDRIISCYWDTPQPPSLGYRAVYLHQITSQQTLFGWLYNDEIETNSSSATPYFICYYLDETLLSFHLETIFTYLQKGPLAIIDRHNVPILLETTVVSNLWNYKPARPGIVISPDICRQCHTALSQGELINLFIPLSAQETVIVPSEQTYEQQIANLSVYQHYIIEGITDEVDNLVLNQSHRKDRQQEHLQSHLNVRSVYEINQKSGSLIKVKEGDLAIARNRTNSLSQVSGEKVPLSHDEQQNLNAISFDQNNLQFLLRIGIIATALALTLSLYRLVHFSILAPIASQVSTNTNTNIPGFYKTLAEVPNIPQGIFNYGGSSILAALHSPGVISSLNQSQRQFQLRFVEPVGSPHGSGVGIRMLLDGKLSFALSSRPLKENELAQAKERGFALDQIPIAVDGITFFVSPSNPIVGLSLLQLQDIFSGKINNWKTVGGPDLQITAFSFDPQVSGTADVVRQRVLAGREFGKNVQVVSTATDSILKVAATPGGIGYSSASVVIGQKNIYPLPVSIASGENFITPFVDENQAVLNKTVFTNGSYPLTRRLFVIVKRDGKLDEQAGSAYTNLLATEEGQKLIEQAGFIPLR